MPKVSVLMTAHNAERYIERVLSSLLQQTFRDFEIVVVDDGSSDSTPSILESLAAASDRIRLIVCETQVGRTPALNIGLRAARSPFIAVNDADDPCLPERLRLQVEYLERHPEAALVASSGVAVDARGEPLRPYPVPANSLALHFLIPFVNRIIHRAVMMRSDIVLGQLGGYDERFVYAQDYDLWARMSERWLMGTLPVPLVHYRIHSQSMWSRHEDLRQSEPWSIQCRQLNRFVPNLSTEDVLTLLVLGAGVKRIPPDVPVQRAVDLLSAYLDAFGAAAPEGLLRNTDWDYWARAQTRRSLLALADTWVFQDDPSRARQTLVWLWRRDPRSLFASLRILAKSVMGPRLRARLAGWKQGRFFGSPRAG